MVENYTNEKKHTVNSIWNSCNFDRLWKIKRPLKRK